jgi:hypothetical protein
LVNLSKDADIPILKEAKAEYACPRELTTRNLRIKVAPILRWR